MSATAPPRPPSRAGVEPAIAARRAAIEAQQRRRRFRWFASAVALLLVIAGGGAATVSPLFDVEQVAVVGAEERRDDVRAAARVEPGSNLLAVDVRAVESRVAALPWVAEAQVSRVPPAALRVEVAPRRPAAVVQLPDRSWIVDAEGVVLEGGSPPDLVRIAAPESVLPGPGSSLSDEAVANALEFHGGLPDELADRVQRYEAPSAGGLRVQLATEEGTVWAWVGRAEEVPLKAAVLSGLIEELPAELAHADEVDVRVPDNPVLVPGAES